MALINNKHPSFTYLHHQHSKGVELCNRIQIGITKGVATARLIDYSDWYWHNIIAPNFEFEEHYIFPILGDKHEYIKKAKKQHRRIRKLFIEMDKNYPLRNLSLLEEELTRLIRFEELVVLKEVLSVATAEQLEFIQDKHELIQFDNWIDNFWK